jgi:broad specificity phosphatase PhoE
VQYGSCELTYLGREQAEQLGKEWTNVRIDQLYSSTLVRALDTARQIAKYNQGTPEIEQSEQIVERYLGTACVQYLKEDDICAYNKEIMGVESGFPPRDYRPGGGGESFEDVAKRG